MFDLNSLTKEEKRELEEYSICQERANEFYQNSIEEYEKKFGVIPREYRIVLDSTLGIGYLLLHNHNIMTLHIPYHYMEYHPLSLLDILSNGKKFNSLHSYYSCFTPEMNRKEINVRINEIQEKKTTNEYIKKLANGLESQIETYLIGMDDILLESLENGRKITGTEAMNILKNSYQEAISSEFEILKPYMKLKGRKETPDKR